MDIEVETDAEKAGFAVLVKGYDEAQSQQYKHAAFIMLDQFIGEYGMETKSAFIELQPSENESQFKRHSLKELPQMFARLHEVIEWLTRDCTLHRGSRGKRTQSSYQ